MSKRFNSLSTAIALAAATALIGGCAMQTRDTETARADTEDASHASTNTTLTAQGDPAPEVATEVALIEQPAAPVQMAQAEPMPAEPQPQPQAQSAYVSSTSQTSASNLPMQPQSNAYASTPAPMPAPAPTSGNASTSYGDSNEVRTLPPRADRN